MMHGHEKSDSAIVAVKPTNKALHSAAEQSTAELFAAEPVEPRAETKRNAGQQSTCGTQGQISVSQALERIRRVAKERKKEKFTSLLHHISKFALLVENRPGDAGKLVGERDRQHIVVQTFFGSLDPGLAPIAVPMLWPDP